MLPLLANKDEYSRHHGRPTDVERDTQRLRATACIASRCALLSSSLHALNTVKRRASSPRSRQRRISLIYCQLDRAARHSAITDIVIALGPVVDRRASEGTSAWLTRRARVRPSGATSSAASLTVGFIGPVVVALAMRAAPRTL